MRIKTLHPVWYGQTKLVAAGVVGEVVSEPDENGLLTARFPGEDRIVVLFPDEYEEVPA